MVKLVLTYDIGDGYTWCSQVHQPFYYESKEKAEYDLYELWEKWDKQRKISYISSDAKFASFDIDLSNLSYEYCEPLILTLDEWFERNL